MVSQNFSTTTEVAGISRGFVTDIEPAMKPSASTGAYFVPVSSLPQTTLPRYWSSVITGTLTFMTIGVFSAALMLGCRVGTLSSGALALGWGAAWWTVITACIAYFFAGWAATCIGERSELSWLRGLGVWALSVPLTAVIAAIVIGGAGLAHGQMSSHITQAFQMNQGALFVSFGGAWTVFVSLIAGAFFSILGASMTPARAVITEPANGADRT